MLYLVLSHRRRALLNVLSKLKINQSIQVANTVKPVVFNISSLYRVINNQMVKQRFIHNYHDKKQIECMGIRISQHLDCTIGIAPCELLMKYHLRKKLDLIQQISKDIAKNKSVIKKYCLEVMFKEGGRSWVKKY